MLFLISTADISHLMRKAPVDIAAILAFHRLTVKKYVSSQPEGPYEERYLQSLEVAAMRLTGNPNDYPSRNDYLAMLMRHHARSILLPIDLLRESFSQSKPAAESAEYFEVPLRVYRMRMGDADILRSVRCRKSEPIKDYLPNLHNGICFDARPSPL